MKFKKDWSHYSSFLLGPDAVQLYRRMMAAPWMAPDADKKTFACHFGLSYTQGPGGARGEIPIIPDFLKSIADRVAESEQVQMPSNYIQCHRMGATAQVRPHRDPSGSDGTKSLELDASTSAGAPA